MPNIRIGHKREFEFLQNAFVNNRFAHAYLIWGEEGIGKKSFAMEIAKSVLCTTNPFVPCNRCPNCNRIDNFQHPDVKYILPVKHNKKGELSYEDYEKQLQNLKENPFNSLQFTGNETIGINDIRSLKGEAKFSPTENNYRFFIIIGIEKMTDQAANALLKLLEEPPSDVIFLLTTSNLDLMLPTVKSRCQLIRLNQFTDTEILNVLKHYYNDHDDQKLATVSQLASGNYINAQNYLRDSLEEDQAFLVEFLLSAFKGNPLEINEAIKNLHQDKDKSELRRFLVLMIQWFKDIVHIKYDKNWQEKIVFTTQQERLEKFYKKFENLDLQNAIAIVENSIHYLDRNGYFPLVVTELALKLKRVMDNAVGERRTA